MKKNNKEQKDKKDKPKKKWHSPKLEILPENTYELPIIHAQYGGGGTGFHIPGGHGIGRATESEVCN